MGEERRQRIGWETLGRSRGGARRRWLGAALLWRRRCGGGGDALRRRRTDKGSGSRGGEGDWFGWLRHADGDLAVMQR
jgi:hypothetical protein